MIKRKLTVAGAALLAVVALAAIPAAASADVELLSGSTPVPVGTQLKGTNVGTIIFELGGGANFGCRSSWSGSLSQNGPSNVKADLSSVTFPGLEGGENCSAGIFGNLRPSLKTPACLTYNSITPVMVRTNGCSVAPTQAELSIYLVGSGLTCNYFSSLALDTPIGTEPLVGTTNGTLFQPVPKQSGSCFNSVTLKGSFEFTKADGSKLKLVKS